MTCNAGIASKAAITIAIRLRFDFDSASIRLRREMNMFIFSSCREASEPIRRQWKGHYSDVIVYVTVIRMELTLTDQNQVASFDCRRCYKLIAFLHTSELKCRLVWIYAFINMCTSTSRIEIESQSNRNFDSYRRNRIVVESKPNRSRIAVESQL